MADTVPLAVQVAAAAAVVVDIVHLVRIAVAVVAVEGTDPASFEGGTVRLDQVVVEGHSEDLLEMDFAAVKKDIAEIPTGSAEEDRLVAAPRWSVHHPAPRWETQDRIVAVAAYTPVGTYLAVVVAPVEGCILVAENLEDTLAQVAVDMVEGLTVESNLVHHLMSIQMARSTVQKFGQRCFWLVPAILQVQTINVNRVRNKKQRPKQKQIKRKYETYHH